MENNQSNNNQKIVLNFLRYLADKGVSVSSLKYYKSDISHFLSWSNGKKVDNNLVKEYINSQRLTTPISTLNRRLSTLRSYSSFIGNNFMSDIENVSNTRKVIKNWQDALISKFEHKPRLKNLISKILFNRPNWYKKYHSFALANYIHIAILILFSSLSGYAVYDQVFYSTDRSLAFPSALTRPNRYLSFQGRLTDDLGNPETVATNMVFKLYSVSSGGVALWNSGTCSITPDQDGIFSTLLGSSCGSEIASSVFSENAGVWLGVTVGADSEATPRIQIATVAYALNSETLQGYPAGTGTSTIPYIDSTGKLAIAAASPTIESTSGTFAVTGQALTISTANTSNGSININPDGTGTLNLTFEGASAGGGANGFINATNANITSGALYGGTVASNATGYNFIDFQSGASPTSVFSVQNDGDIITSGDITIGGGNINTGNIALTIGDATTDSITLQTDGTGNGEVVLPNDSISPDEVASGSQTDEYCLTYEATGDTWEWQTCSAGGTMSAFTAAGDTGVNQTINDGNTLSILGGTNGIDTVGSATDTITLNLDTTEIGTTTFGSGSAITWTFDASAGTDTTLTFGNNLITVGQGLTVTGTTTTDGTLAANGIVTLGDGGDLITISGSDTNIAVIDGSTINLDGDGSPTADLFQIGNGDTTTTTGVDALNVTFGASNVSSDLIHLTPAYAGGATDTLTFNIFEVDAFSPTNASGTDTVNGIKFGNLTDPGATITSTAINIGTGWDTILGGTTAGTNLFSFTNATLTSAGNLSLAGTTGLTFSSTGGINLAGGTISDTSDEVDINDDLAVSGILQVGGTSATTYSRLGTSTTGHSGNLTASSDLLLQDLEVDGTFFLDGGTLANSAGTASIILSSTPATTANTLSASNWLVENTANVGQAALMVNQTKSGDLFTASASGTTKFTIQNDGDVVLTNGQLRLGNLSSAPTAEGAGSMFFNTTTNTNQCYNGTNWFNCGGTLYSNTNASVADGSYITVTHSLGTNDLLASAWINAQGTWKSLESSYQPAIAWEGKDTEKGVYHNQVNSYTPQEETGTGTSTLQDGLLFDTFEDATKTDSANTTISTNTQITDDGGSNYATLNQRVQGGRVGLTGGQTYATSTSDNDSHTYLGSNTVNDTYYYDRSKDSSPDVLVELGIDPNWYNGVTLSVATTSATYSQGGTLADKNPNLTTNYNGSLIKATGTDSTPRTIYITIKTPTTFDWTNYQGDSATGVTITPGTAQTLGSTGVSVTFTGGVNYNVGDVFKIASWFIEGSSSTRGSKQQFPERSYVVLNGEYTSIIDADTQKLWMSIHQEAWKSAASPDAIKMLNGSLYIAANNGGSSDGNLRVLKFTNDTEYFIYQDATYQSNVDNSIASRNTAGTSGSVISSIGLVTKYANDVDAVVIPNKPTQEVTVSGWGFIQGNNAGYGLGETVPLPYKFNNAPNVTVGFVGASAASTTPTSIESCTTEYLTNGSNQATDITKNSFYVNFTLADAGTYSSSYYFCYTWTATGTVSPKQFVAVATGATNADGGTTIFNETDGTKADIEVGGNLVGGTLWENKVALAGNSVYTDLSYYEAGASYLTVHRGVHGLTTESGWADYRHECYGVNAICAPYIIILGTTTTQNITSLAVTPNTSTHDPESNTIYVGTPAGVSVIQERDGKANVSDAAYEYDGSVKYYTKDYVSEEMIGDIRGMWPLNNANSSSDFEDVSIKANTLTGTNITANGDSVSGVRGTATDFDGSTEYLSCTDASCGGTSKLDITGNFSLGVWIKPSTTSAGTYAIMTKEGVNTGYWLYRNGANIYTGFGNGSSYQSQTSSTSPLTANEWTHVIVTWDGSTIRTYINGTLIQSTALSGNPSDSAGNFYIGALGSGPSQYFSGSIDEPFITATVLTAGQIKNMYQVGYRALQSHSTGLGGGAADSNQQLGYISTGTNTVGVVQPDYNNQYMYVGTNSTTLGALSKIQLNSDTNVKTYNSSANVPSGGTLLLDEDVTSLAVGETLYAVGSAASGVKSMGYDNNSTATSGNFVSKTYTLPKNIGSAVIWASPVLDSSDGSNTVTVKASNDGGSSYVTCTLINTNSNVTVPEKEYACTFTTASNSLKVKFEFVRGSTKTNTYVVQYGISWLGETGFRVEQYDTNNVRLYNYSGETQNLKLNVTGASTAALANPWTDAGSYLYPTGYESLRVYDGAGSNYLSLSNSGTYAQLGWNGTAAININSAGGVGIGTTSIGNAGLNLNYNSSQTAANAYLQFIDGAQTTANSAGFYGQVVQPSYSATSGNTLASLFGSYINPANSSSGTVTSLVGVESLPVNSSSGVVSGLYGVISQPTKSGTGTVSSAFGLYSRVDNTNATGAITDAYGLYIGDSTETGTITNDWGVYQVDTGALNYFGGNTGIGSNAPGNDKLRVVNDHSGSFAGFFFHDGNAADRYGIGIQNGTDDNSGTNIHTIFYDGDGTEVGRITSTTGTVTYGAFTANHDTSIPEEVNASGYQYGTLLCIDNAHANTDPSRNRNIVYQSRACDDGPYSNKVLGAYAGKYSEQENLHQVYVLGDGQILVNGENGDIKTGDPITTSSTTGIGMKATDYGTTIGRAQEDYHFSDANETKLIAVQYGLGYSMPNTYLTDSGDFEITGENNNYAVSNTQNNTIATKIGAFAKATIASIQAGVVNSRKLVSPIINTNIISPVADSDLIVDLQPDNNAETSKLVIKGKDDKEVASIDALGNAKFSGDATVSGTLYVDDIESKRLSDIEDLLHQVELNQNLLTEASNWNNNTATDSASLEGVFTNLTAQNLYVTDQLATNSLFVSNNLTVNKIDSLDTPLQIQSLASSSLEIMAGKIKIDTDGNVKFEGNVEIAGNLTLNSLLVASIVEETATGSASINLNEITTNAIAGKATLLANEAEMTINNPKVGQNTLIYITPISNTQNHVMYVKSKEEGLFKVGFSDPIDSDVEFNWWIIELGGMHQ